MTLQVKAAQPSLWGEVVVLEGQAFGSLWGLFHWGRHKFPTSRCSPACQLSGDTRAGAGRWSQWWRPVGRGPTEDNLLSLPPPTPQPPFLLPSDL